MIVKMFCLAAAAVLTAAGVFAEEIAPEEIVVTATPLRERAGDFAQPAMVLGGDELRRDVASSIGETLAAEPGISATYFGPAASRPVIRGLSGDRVLILSDGVSALDASSLSADHAVSVESVLAERVEILKGPATLLYGSGAVGGVVNVLDGRLPADFTGRADSDFDLGGAVEVRGDSAASERAAVGKLNLATDRLRLHLDAFRRATDEVSIPGFAFSAAQRAQEEAEEEDPSFARGRLPNSDSETQGGSMGIAMGGAAGFAGISWSRFDTRYGVPLPHEHEHEDEDEPEEESGQAPADARIDMLQDRYDFKAERTAATGPFSALRLRGTYNDYRHVELEGAEIATVFEQQALDARLTLEHAQRREGWNGAFGVHYLDVDFTAAGEEAFVPSSTTRTLGLFVFEKRAFGDFALELGARLENQKITLNGGTGDHEDKAYSLSAGGLWQLNAEYALALSLTRSQRHPQAAELFAEGPHLASGQFERGNAALQRETARTADLTLHHHAGALHWSAGVFYNDFSDYIFAAPLGVLEDGLPVFVYVQQDAQFYGFEGEISLPIWTAGDRLFEARLASDFVRGRVQDGGDLPRMPPLRYGFELHYEQGALHLGMRAFFHNRQDRTAPNERSSAGYTLMDADVSYRFDLGARGSVLAFLRGSNLLDEEARRHTSPLKEFAPLPGRSAAAGIRMEF